LRPSDVRSIVAQLKQAMDAMAASYPGNPAGLVVKEHVGSYDVSKGMGSTDPPILFQFTIWD